MIESDHYNPKAGTAGRSSPGNFRSADHRPGSFHGSTKCCWPMEAGNLHRVRRAVRAHHRFFETIAPNFPLSPRRRLRPSGQCFPAAISESARSGRRFRSGCFPAIPARLQCELREWQADGREQRGNDLKKAMAESVCGPIRSSVKSQNGILWRSGCVANANSFGDENIFHLGSTGWTSFGTRFMILR